MFPTLWNSFFKDKKVCYTEVIVLFKHIYICKEQMFLSYFVST